MPVNIPWNTMADPSPTARPVMFEPPSALTNGRREVWIAAGGGEHWGGCEVWASVNDESYDKVGIINHGCAVGSLFSPFPAGQDPDAANTLAVGMALSQGVLHPGSQSDADKFVTLCWVDGELVAYTAARLAAPWTYAIEGYKRRGCFGTPILDHRAGAPFARLNQAVWRFEYPPNLIGHPVHVKLPAFNEFMGQLQGLDQVPSYSLTLTGASAT
jgi:hypothetical protein